MHSVRRFLIIQLSNTRAKSDRLGVPIGADKGKQ